MTIEILNIPKMAEKYKIQVKYDTVFLKKLFSETSTNNCHKLHILQMCFEKYAKYLQLKQGCSINKTHNYVHKVFPQAFENRYKSEYGKEKSFSEIKKSLRIICREIDLLAPAHYGADIANPVNCEYPWEMTDSNGKNPRAYAPCEYNFEVLNAKYGPILRKMISMVEEEVSH